MPSEEHTATVQRKPIRHREYDAVQITKTDHEEFFHTVRPRSGESGLALIQRTLNILGQVGAQPLSFEIIGGLPSIETYRAAVDEAQAPITWIGQEHLPEDSLRGLQVWSVTESPVEPIWVDETLVGTVFEDSTARYCRLGGLMPATSSAGVDVQTREVFDRMERGLTGAGFSFDDVLRTWYYNRDMLTWYDLFNDVRHEYFRAWGVFDGMVPASTGVGGTNPYDDALQAEALAVRPKDDTPCVRAIPSPLQCPALEYGSAFSRAAEFDLPGGRRLFVSGTASIAPAGETIFVGDMDGQIQLTMQVVQAILHSRDMDWLDVTRAIVYIKQPEHMAAYEAYCRRQALPLFPSVMVCNDICREDLLFEIELDAVSVH